MIDFRSVLIGFSIGCSVGIVIGYKAKTSAPTQYRKIPCAYLDRDYLMDRIGDRLPIKAKCIYVSM